MINYSDITFVTSVFKPSQLPVAEYPEIAFAGRSNVGKSSLINKLVGRKSIVKVSSKPGKTRSLNYFLVDQTLYLVDLPGYGYAKVPKKMKEEWQGLLTTYLGTRDVLCCVVVIIDIRHSLKIQDRQLIDWLRDNGIPSLPVYTKKDKLKKNQQNRQAAGLDAALNIRPSERVLFSSKTGEGKENLIAALDRFLF